MSQKEGEWTGILFVMVERGRGVIMGGNGEKLHVKSRVRVGMTLWIRLFVKQGNRH